MTVRTTPFTVPADRDFLHEFGSEPVAADAAEPWRRVLTVPVGESAELVLSFDEIAATVQLVWTVSGRTVLSLYREKAVRLGLVTENGISGFSVEFDSTELGGNLNVQVYPHVSVTDSLLVSGR